MPGEWKSEFQYDGLGRRRITKEYTWSQGAWSLTDETRYIYDGMLVLQERDGNNQPQVTYTRGLDLSGSYQGAGGIGGLLARTDASGSAYYHTDANGNVVALVDASGTLQAQYLYDPYGNLLGKQGPLADANRYRFSSKEYHEPNWRHEEGRSDPGGSSSLWGKSRWPCSARRRMSASTDTS